MAELAWQKRASRRKAAVIGAQHLNTVGHDGVSAGTHPRRDAEALQLQEAQHDFEVLQLQNQVVHLKKLVEMYKAPLRLERMI